MKSCVEIVLRSAVKSKTIYLGEEKELPGFVRGQWVSFERV